MQYAELSYPFPGTTPHHFQHIAARDDHKRVERLQKLAEDSQRGSRLTGTLGVRFGL